MYILSVTHVLLKVNIYLQFIRMIYYSTFIRTDSNNIIEKSSFVFYHFLSIIILYGNIKYNSIYRFVLLYSFDLEVKLRI